MAWPSPRWRFHGSSFLALVIFRLRPVIGEVLTAPSMSARSRLRRQRARGDDDLQTRALLHRSWSSGIPSPAPARCARCFCFKRGLPLRQWYRSCQSSFPDFLASARARSSPCTSRASSFSTMRTRVGCLVSGPAMTSRWNDESGLDATHDASLLACCDNGARATIRTPSTMVMIASLLDGAFLATPNRLRG